MTAKSDEQTVYGYRSCMALFARRRQDIMRIYYGDERIPVLGEVLKWAASCRLPYRQLAGEELEKVSESTHHEGLVMVARPAVLRQLDFASIAPGQTWVALDDVRNPHNIGAIVRSCAFFGVRGVLIGDAAPGARVNGATLRMAEGGAEMVALYGCTKLSPSLAALRKAGVPVVGLETGAAQAFGAERLPSGAALVFGNEQTGLTPGVRRACSEIGEIPGAWKDGSLNVSVAVGVALAILTMAAKGAPPRAGGGQSG